MAQIGKKHFTKAGFTLVETLIVSVIVVLLIALAYPALEKVRDKYRERAIVENLEKVVAAGLQYIEEKKVQSVDMQTLETMGYIQAPKPVFGENYSGLRVVVEGGVLSVLDKDRNQLSLTY